MNDDMNDDTIPPFIRQLVLMVFGLFACAFLVVAAAENNHVDAAAAVGELKEAPLWADAVDQANAERKLVARALALEAARSRFPRTAVHVPERDPETWRAELSRIVKLADIAAAELVPDPE